MSSKKVIQVFNLGNNFISEIVPIPPKPEGATRFVCLSDTHGYELALKIPDGDVLLHAGDFTDTGEVRKVGSFNKFLGSLPHKHKIVIAGNHEVTFEPLYYQYNWRRFHHKMQDAAQARAMLTNCIYLEDSEVTVEGFKIYGSPWSPAFCNWAFNLHTPPQTQEEWDKIPAGVDILITHGPPRGHGDANMSGQACGCPILLSKVQQLQPALHFFGHIHEGYGVSNEGPTTCVNASNSSMGAALNNPIVIDMI